MLILVSLKFHNMEEDIFSEENSNFIDDGLEQQEISVLQDKEERPEEEEQQEKEKYFYDKMSSYRSSFSSEIHLRNACSGDGLEQQEISVLQDKEERPEEEEQQEKEGQQEKKKYFYDSRSDFSDIHVRNSYNTGLGDRLEQQEISVLQEKEERPEKEKQLLQKQLEKEKQQQILQTISRYKLFSLFGNYSEEEMQNSYFPQFFFSKYDAYEFKTLNNSVSNKNLLNYNKATNGLNF